MANALQTLFSDIANMIRRKSGKPDDYLMSPASFPTEIENIPTSGGGSFETDVIVEEITVTTSASSNKDFDGLCGAPLPITEAWQSKTIDERTYIDQVFLVTFDGTKYLIGFGTGVIAKKATVWGQEQKNHPMVILGNWELVTTQMGGLASMDEWMHECKKNYPFVINIGQIDDESSVHILTKTAGTHTVKLERMPSTL